MVYDIGGNITNDGSRSYTYTPFDIPDSITQTISGGSNPGIYQSEWGFGPDKQRTFELMRKAPIGSSTFAPIGMTWFAGAGHFELDEEIDANGNWVVNEFRHTIGSPEGAIGVVAVAVNSGGSSITDRYFLKDHLGSNAGTFTANGLESRATYDVWGNRISSGTPALSGFDTSQRGYTGHEHLATYGLIHMNGRIYDPLLGRFLQADPIIQSPYDLQSYNRYAYVMNNPLAYTDPTGYSRWTKHRKTFWAAVATVVTYGAASAYMTGAAIASGSSTSLATVAVSSEAGGLIGASLTGTGQAVAAAASGFASGGIQGGNLNSALSGAVTGAVTSGVNFAVSGSNLAVQVGAKMATSAAIAYVQGGDWRRAAYFAGFAQLGKAGWEYTQEQTDKLYDASCARHGNCASDDHGRQTDGGRNLKPGFKEGEEDRIPGAVKSYFDAGMSAEGKPHMYSPGQAFCSSMGSVLCSAIRGFTRQVSKPHDWGNSWGYDRDPLSLSYGDRIQGGGFTSLGARVVYEVGMQTWSFATMPVMAGFTAVSLYGDYFNPNLYGRRR